MEQVKPEVPSTSAQHVDVNYFNPDGATELRKTVSRLSTRTQDIEAGSIDSAATLDNSFDFRKALERVSQQCVFSYISRFPVSSCSDATMRISSPESSVLCLKTCA